MLTPEHLLSGQGTLILHIYTIMCRLYYYIYACIYMNNILSFVKVVNFAMDD